MRVCVCIYIYLYVCVWRERSYVQLFQAKFIVYPSAYKVVLGFCSSHAEMIIQVLASNKRFERVSGDRAKTWNDFFKTFESHGGPGREAEGAKRQKFLRCSKKCGRYDPTKWD